MSTSSSMSLLLFVIVMVSSVESAAIRLRPVGSLFFLNRPHEKRAFDSLAGSGFGAFNKRAFDSMAGQGFSGFDKRAFDSLAGSGFGAFNKRAFDSLAGSGFGAFNKRAFDSLAGSGFSGFDKRAFDSLAGQGFTGFEKRAFDTVVTSNSGLPIIEKKNSRAHPGSMISNCEDNNRHDSKTNSNIKNHAHNFIEVARF